MNTHTRTPWKTEPFAWTGAYIKTDWKSADGFENIICQMKGAYMAGESITAANAEFIVRACNCHDELVAALTKCDHLLTVHGQGWINASNEGHEAWRSARAALQKAKGE